MDNENTHEDCQKRCTCSNNKSSGQKIENKIPRSSQEFQDASRTSEQQKAFIAFITEIICVIAFVLFGSVVFWLSVGGVLFDYLKQFYYSDRRVKIGMVCLFSILLLSMSVRVFLNKRTCRSQLNQIQNDSYKNIERVSQQENPAPPKPPQDYIDLFFRDETLRHHYNGGEEDKDKYISKALTLTIADENKNPVFKTSKLFYIPEMAMRMKKPPGILVYLKEIILEEY